MPVSKNASKLLLWLQRYDITASNLISRIPIFKQRGAIIKSALTELTTPNNVPTTILRPISYDGGVTEGIIDIEYKNIFFNTLLLMKYDEINEVWLDNSEDVLVFLFSELLGGEDEGNVQVDNNTAFDVSTPFWPVQEAGLYRIILAGWPLEELEFVNDTWVPLEGFEEPSFTSNTLEIQIISAP